MSTFPQLSYVCPIRWEELVGDDREKFCATCGHHVSNLSLMSTREREALLAHARTERLCVSYYRRLSGEDVTPESPLTAAERSRTKQLGIAALAAGALSIAAGCASTTALAPKHGSPPQADAADETIVLQAMGIVLPPK